MFSHKVRPVTVLMVALSLLCTMAVPVTPSADAADSTDSVQIESCQTSEGDDMVINGGFEEVSDGMPVHWGTWTPIGSPDISADTKSAYSGQTSLRITADEDSRAAVVQTRPLTSGQKDQTYKFKAWIKTEDVTGEALNRIQFVNSGGGRVTDTPLITLDGLQGTNDWTLVERIIEIPDHDEVDGVKFENFWETGTGTAWFDDVSFIPWHPIESIHFDQDEYALMPGESVTPYVTFVPENASDKRLKWHSSNDSVASVDEEGEVTARANGIAAITATASDGNKTATCLIIVGEPSGIIVTDYDEETNQGASVSGEIEAKSDDGKFLSYWKAVDSAHGLTHVTQDGHWSYYPDRAFTGTDRFVVAVEDEDGSFAVSRVTVTVHPVNRSPILEEDIQPTDKNTPVSGQVMAEDPDDDPLTFTVETHPQHGSVAVDEGGNWTYTPDNDYTGADSFTVNVSDNRGGSDTGLIRLYVAPTAGEIISEIKEKNPNHRHPRILANESDFERIRALLETDDNVQTWFEGVKEEADALLSQPPVEYRKPDGLRLDTTSSKRIVTLAFMFKVTGDDRYAERAWTELDFVSGEAYPDWSPEHFLDTATMTHGVSVGYDWLSDYLDSEQRSVIRQAIVQKALEPAIPMYIDRAYWWVYNRDNWNFVCNAGMTLGALAIADEEEEVAGTILREAFKSIQYGLTQYAPDGSAIEGPAYWEYGTIYLTYFLSSLDASTGHDFGFSEREGLAETPRFPVYIAGANGSFNYSDNDENLVPGRLLLWFADKFNKPEYTWYHQYVYGKTGNAGLYDILWYRPDTYGASEPAHLDQHFELPHAVTMRNSWSDSNALFAGFKGGVNGAPHGDLDTGSFVFDAYGVRWAIDLGKEDYNLPGYWNMDEDGKRWTYYRKRAEGHNTLVINPSEKPDQDVVAVSEIVRQEFARPQGAFAITDMTAAYHEHAASVKRGTALVDHRRQFLIQDEVKMKIPSELYWFMHTRANIEITDNGTAAILTQGDKRLWVQILSPLKASFSEMAAEPLATSPNPDGQTENLGVKKLAIHLENVLESTISVWMLPLMPGDPLPKHPPTVVPLDEWEVPEGELAELKEIKIDGAPLPEFDSNRYVYEQTVPAGEDRVPVVEAEAANSGDEVTVQQAEQIPGVARIEVTDPNGGKDAGIYYVSFIHPKEHGIPVDRPALSIGSVAASDHDGNVPENTIDGNPNTRWSASGKQWIQYVLEDIQDVSAVSVAWYQGHTRYSFFNIETSENGEQWQKVYDGSSSGETEEHEVYEFPETTARYVRINGFGNNLNQWNSITEVGIYGPKGDLNAVSLKKAVERFEDDGEFATDDVSRALKVHLTAVSRFEKKEKPEKVVKHMKSFTQLLDRQKNEELISEKAYHFLKVNAETLIRKWQ